MMALKMPDTFIVKSLPAFKDNYIWLIVNAGNRECLAIDPGDATTVRQTLEREQLVLKWILVTHHHPDHTGGIAELRQWYPETSVYAPALEAISGTTQPLAGGEILTPWPEMEIQVLSTPGHTRGHLSYYCPALHWLFCGDTLFSAGCGRLFDGTMDQLFSSLNRIRSLPEDTQIFCAHEYTEANVRFALTVDPDNPELLEFADFVTQRRVSLQPTVPTLLAREKRVNPFLRWDDSSVISFAQRADPTCENSPVSTFAALRRSKDRF